MIKAGEPHMDSFLLLSFCWHTILVYETCILSFHTNINFYNHGIFERMKGKRITFMQVFLAFHACKRQDNYII
jgi:hypothetical protein